MKKIGYIGIGLILLIATIATGNYGLSKENQDIYKKALEKQDEIDKMGFRNFQLSEYPVSFYDGNYDYVMRVDDGTYSVNKREPVLDTFVGTTYQVDDHYEVIVPTIEKFEKLFDVLNLASGMGEASEGGDISFEKDSYGEKEHVATIWHEAFHAYQCTYAMEQERKLLAGHTFSEDDLDEQLIVEEIDSNEQVKGIYEKQLELLKKAVNLTDVDNLKEIILQYKKLEEERRALLSEDVLILEEYYTRMEGTAYYIEGFIYKSLYSEEAFQSRYVDDIDVYTQGSNKYYKIGMAQCMILDHLDDEWKADYNFSESIMDLIYERLEI